MRKVGPHLLKEGGHGVGRVQRVGVRGKLDAEARSGLAVVARSRRIAFLPQFHPGHVPQPHGGAVRVDAQEDSLELRYGGQPFLRLDGHVDLLPVKDGFRADLPERNLRVLRLHRRDHVRGRQLVGKEL